MKIACRDFERNGRAKHGGVMLEIFDFSTPELLIKLGRKALRNGKTAHESLIVVIVPADRNFPREQRIVLFEKGQSQT
jgi:hypothetical protein